MLINGTEYDLILNPPLVEEAKIAEPLMAGFFTNPTKIEVSMYFRKDFLRRLD